MNSIEYTDFIMHYRTPGSLNGVSHTPGYDAVGKKAMTEAERNAKYSEKQRVRDRKIYGRRAEKRINKRMNAGEGVQSARHDEVVRREHKIAVKKKIKKAAKIGGLIIGSAALIDLAARGRDSVLGKGVLGAVDSLHRTTGRFTARRDSSRYTVSQMIERGKQMGARHRSQREKVARGLDFFKDAGKGIVYSVMGKL